MKKVLLPVLFASAGLMLLTGCKDSPAAVTKKFVKACQDGNEVAAKFGIVPATIPTIRPTKFCLITCAPSCSARVRSSPPPKWAT